MAKLTVMPNKKTYEQAIGRLEEIVRLLEEGELPLEDSVKLYAESVELSDFCYKKLNEFEEKIKLLSTGEKTDD